ncbi:MULTISPECIES: hypothetical protein [unclassified Virgibacillus]|uniref:hypothetical protein n=1 Tax=unclassified Virgibacillus TaxID=2620237 RepID=UPI000909E3CB|nr:MULTISPECIES: hypothetical protein [unclassified Virgibacillus]API92701.1 hypothetical protein BKP57_13330 [Virgibacillus sp. 6R]MBS7428196.1 hypothetical protein [Virgibacillus sp. 19R1-5]
MDWKCDGCGKGIKIPNDYKPEFCCDGHECGCCGEPINPMFCDDCERCFIGEPSKYDGDILD